MRATKLLTLLLFLIVNTSGLCGQGLMFNGMESPIEKRTSYNVFVSRVPEFRDSLKISFSLSMYHKSDFGYILRIKNTETERIFNLLYSGEDWNKQFPLRLNEEGRSSIIKADIPHEHFETGKWISVNLTFRMKEGKILLKVDDYIYETYVDSMPCSWSPVINFGKSDYMIDVPSMAIKDLVIEDGKRKYSFPLNEFEGDKVKDSRHRITGLVSNPEWLTYKSYKWDLVASFKSATKAGYNYDSFRKSIVYYNKDSAYVYNIVNKQYDFIRYSSPCPVDIYLGSSFINPCDSLLYLYEAYQNPHNTTGATVASYDIENNSWTVRSSSTLPTRFHHHSSCFDKHNGRFMVFGGFGDMAYNGDFYSYDLEDCEWKKDTIPSGDKIHPRYFSSLGYDEKTDALYIFGGMGNESGEQIVGRHYFYDLHKVDLKSGKSTNVWGKDKKMEWKEENMVPVRNMIVQDSCFYTMCYPEFYTNSHLQLFRFDMRDASYTKLCEKVPIRSDRMSTNANLYFDKDMQILILAVMESSDDIRSQLKIYTLSFPPLSETEYTALVEKSYTWIIITGSLTILALTLFLIIYKKRRKRKSMSVKYVGGGKKRYFVEQKPNSICLFGGFSAKGINGNDIPFPYQQKKLFCLILKYSLDSGISSTRLSKIMWPDKSEDKVKNSRGVAINHLRRLFENFEGLSLIYENSRFKIQTTDSFSCDWMDFKNELSSDNPDMGIIMSIVSRGKFMPLIEDPVFDSFKESTETSIINILCKELADKFNAKQYQEVVDMADIVTYTDPLNEQALGWQLNALVKMKRTEDALVRYSAFVKEYKASYDSEYEHDFKSLIN